MTQFVVLNVVACEPSARESLVAELSGRMTEMSASRAPGFVGAEVLAGEDGQSVATLTRWRDRAAFEAFRADERVRERLVEVLDHHPRISFFESALRLPTGGR
jgi:heme-degrading monooxygenase HmoA